jgi:hypothetical protein
LGNPSYGRHSTRRAKENESYFKVPFKKEIGGSQEKPALVFC